MFFANFLLQANTAAKDEEVFDATAKIILQMLTKIVRFCPSNVLYYAAFRMFCNIYICA